MDDRPITGARQHWQPSWTPGPTPPNDDGIAADPRDAFHNGENFWPPTTAFETYREIRRLRRLRYPPEALEYDDAPLREEYHPAEELDTEFKRKYPPDRFGEEMADNARVWKVYRDEATVRDEAMLDGWNKTLDILLIFSGLFSAVATAFIIESYKLLQPNIDGYNARALYLLVATHGSAKELPYNLAELPALPGSAVSSASRWINGLWLTSLFLSLAVALLCILAKQWLTQYKNKTTLAASTPRYWALRRSLYYDGLYKWHLPAFMSTLPLFLHAALFLFFGGLVLFMSDLDGHIATFLLALTVALAVFYVACLLLPALKLDCPTYTPLLDQLSALAHAVSDAGQVMAFRLLKMILTSHSWDWRSFSAELRRRTIGRVFTSVRIASIRLHLAWRWRSWRIRHFLWDTIHADRPHDTRLRSPYLTREQAEIRTRAILGMDADPLRWLLRECSTPEVLSVACQAPAALYPASLAVEKLRKDREYASGLERSVAAYAAAHPGRPTVDPLLQGDLARYARASLCVKSDSNLWLWPSASEPHGLGMRLLGSLPLLNSEALRTVLEESLNAATCCTSNKVCRSPFPTSLALQVLSHKSLWDIDCQLLLIACLDVYALDPFDISEVARSLYRDTEHPVHELGICTLPCVMDAICRLMLPRSSGFYNGWSRETCIHIVVHLLRGPGNTLSEWRVRPSFTDVSNIWTLANSDFLAGQWPSYALRNFTEFACALVTPGLASPGQPSRHITDVWGALQRLLELAHRDSVQPVDRYDLVKTIANALIVAMFPPDSPYAAFDTPKFPPSLPPPPGFASPPKPPASTSKRAHIPEFNSHRIPPSRANPISFDDINDPHSMKVAGPLALLLRTHDKPSMWELLTANWASWRNGPASVMHLAGIIASHLCFYSRRTVLGIDILISEFFSCECLGVLLGPGEQTHLSDMLKHCLELRHDWWTGIKARIAQLPYDASTTPRLHAIVELVDAWTREQQLERCTACGFAPLRQWAVVDDDVRDVNSESYYAPGRLGLEEAGRAV